ncbi:MAG: Crp/Fnr family transcriptional regulator [Hyphomonadaceae bacterium]
MGGRPSVQARGFPVIKQGVSFPSGTWVGQLTAPARAAFMAAGRERSYPAGALFQHFAHAPVGLFVLLEGTAYAYLANAKGDNLLLRILARGEILNEVAGADDLPAPVFGAARTAISTFFIPWRRFQQLRAQYIDIHLAVAVAATRRYRAALRVVEELSLMTLRERAMARLAWPAQDAAGKAVLDAPAPIDLTQTELAAMLGVTRQATNKILAQLEEEGLLAAQPRRIIVHQRLVTLAHADRPLAVTAPFPSLGDDQST